VREGVIPFTPRLGDKREHRMIEQIDDRVREEVERRLAAIEAVEGVRFLLAVESGSRAWGFPSPDSDFDIRFVYVRSRDWHLGLEPGRDVIEAPIEDDIDLNGWDVRKAILLMTRSNVTVSEWLASPIRYRPDHPMTERLAETADQLFDPRGVAHHYANVGRNAAERWLGHDGDVPVKRYFYALRPALAIRALRRDPTRRPPMNLQSLMASCDLPTEFSDMIDELVVAKRKTREQGTARRLPELDALIRDELARAAELPERKPSEGARKAANRLFLDLVHA